MMPTILEVVVAVVGSLWFGFSLLLGIHTDWGAASIRHLVCLACPFLAPFILWPTRIWVAEFLKDPVPTCLRDIIRRGW